METEELIPLIEQVKSTAVKRLDQITDDVEDMKTKQRDQMLILQDLAQKAVPGSTVTGDPRVGDHSAAKEFFSKAAPELEAMSKGRRGVATLDIPSGAWSTKAVTVTSSTVGYGVNTRPGIVAPAQRRTFLRDLLPVQQVEQGSVQWLKETSATNSAAVVAENTLKPQSDVAVAVQTTPMATIAHWILATKIILDDLPILMQYLDGRLRYFLSLIEDAQLLFGSGSGGNINGMYTQATAAAAYVTGDTKMDQLRRVIEQLQLAEFVPDAIVLSPADWMAISLLKDSQGRYLFGSPAAPEGPTIWDTRVVVTNAMTAGSFLVGDLQLGALLFDRQVATVEISSEDSDNFRKNLVTIRAEERLGLAVINSAALVKGTFGS